ncbi:MAG TPA: mechanosensitive ion channel family protein [Terriglobales bacterium]|nr:mechanosensitive ion channel family protein [Terriglobales bacterium]HZR65059.1 mechanosensitive ion channel family protein [Terriglobales bacterium]
MTDHVFRWTEFALGHGTRLLVILLIALLLIRVLRILTRRLIAAAGNQTATRVARMREQQTRTLAGILYSGGTAVIVIVAVLTALPEFGFNITPVAAAAGLASLSIGFGAQHVVRDFINGFFTVLEDQYVVGDIVRIGDIVGRVEHITLRRTVVRDPQGAVVTIPNGEISKVANLSRDWGQVFLDAMISADQPLDDALSALEGVAAEFRSDPSWSPMLLDGPRVLGVECLAPNGTTVRLQVRTAPTRQDDVARELRRRIQIELAGRGIQIGGVQRMQLLGSEREPSRVARR